jgi:hypothetical protein
MLFYLITITVLNSKNNKNGFKSAIVSSVYLNTINMDINDLLRRINILNLRSLNLVLKNSKNINKELMKNYFLKNIYFVLILNLLMYILIIL